MKSRSVRTQKLDRRGTRRGVVTVEYAMLLVIVAIPSIAAIIAAGVKVVDDYTLTRNSVLHQGP
jgi:hypothetical protein